MKRPIEPDKEDCCNSGCNPCIFDIYESRLKLYENSLRDNNEYFKESDNGISQLEYTAFTVVGNYNITQCHKLLVFRNESSPKSKVWWTAGHHFLYKHLSNKPCTKAYTPLKLYTIKNTEPFDFMTIVKDYGNTSISSYLCSLKVGDKTLWRGPYGSYKHIVNKYQRIIMIAQGTGLAPFYSIIKQILDNEDDYTKITLLFCCQNSNEILLRNELYDCNSYWNFTYKVFISNNVNISDRKYKEPLEDHRLTYSDINIYKPFTPDDQALICGSSEFMSGFQKLLNGDGFAMENTHLF